MASLSRRMTWRVQIQTRSTTCIRASSQPLQLQLQQHHHHHRRGFSSKASSINTGSSSSISWHAQASLPSSRVQVYTSRSRDPYLNLSAEHFLLQNSHPDSTVLFLYANDPCVVIGRNQNPWLEVSLVRRRSGGGAVFHDTGNVNYSVICPPAVFDRNRHAEMVVRALRGLDVVGSPLVNERHDIVLADADADAEAGSTFKISGSAYKLTRLRSLHHGTCLLNSPNLGDIGRLLRSPAEPYVKARGVESVRSRIRNVGLSNDEFIEAVREEFGAMYGSPDVEVELGGARDASDFAHEQIEKGYRELTSRDWIYNQTPQFTFSTHPTEDDPRERPPLPEGVPEDFRAKIIARHGQIQEADLSGFDGGSLEGQNIHEITDWRHVLKPGHSTALENVGHWFNNLFGTNVK
ncbi:hypothetical protein VMCG_04112 [Cytospora schulzeri]|uniref:Putative lipoate-protein ligase A n=1 Tax=Cytospora schulzeri TaxID=448051 RepID=A0A423WTQ5_9PEZI|nr:hypothetical protein VMCG_04112 [Valsa malicola]